ncbi:hypothetical protein SAMN02745166_02710 [Prosthecobacter debontii]|uniref:KH domain-containing protein n=1 Tax=Prosthecobacter debontii TaxID=48467 RepID=A0A1T4Y966_9BACT|nr:KH domain-containing protein [Prosthecobacter debontii]SKA98240.1 hypothetical protein SAMN02745166_02710 [Prosthecobacter debontii]
MDAPEALREFLTYVVANLIDHPQQASIAIGHNANGVLVFRVQLAPEDVKHVLGKNGMTASSIRSLLSAAAEKHGVRVNLKIGAVREAAEGDDEGLEAEPIRDSEKASADC